MGETRSPVVERAIATIGSDGRVAETTRLRRGNRKLTTLVRFTNGTKVVIQSASDRRAIETEHRVLATLESTSVPVPPVVGHGIHADCGWIATGWVAGENLHERFVELTPDRRRAIVSALGRSLAVAHERFQFDSHGQLAVGADGLSVLDTDPGESSADPTTAVADPATAAADPAWGPPSTADGSAWLSAYGRAHVRRLPEAFDPIRGALLAVLEDPPVTTSSPRLFPWDLRPGNALVSDGDLAAILDWEAPLAADPALSVATTEYLAADWYVPDESDSLREAFREGYRSVREFPTVTRAHQAAGIANSVVDSQGVVTNPLYPPVDRENAVEFHRRAFERALS